MADGEEKEKDKKARDLLDQLQKLGTRAAEEFFVLVHRVNQARDEADGTPFSGGDNSGASTEPRRSGGELLYDLLKLQLDAANKLIDISHRHTDLVFDRMQRVATSFVPPEERLTRLKTETSANRPARWDVYVHNAAHRARRLKLRPVGQWQDADGKDVAPCEVKIAAPDVPARCERKLEITQDASDKLASGHEYTAEIQLVLDRQVVGTLELTLKVS